jgi:hypothetical protein
MSLKVTVTFVPEDVATLREDWDDEKCEHFLWYCKRQLEERMTERGWNVLEDLLSMFEKEEKESS